MLVPYSWFQILWYFYIYGFLGWCSEVAFAAPARMGQKRQNGQKHSGVPFQAFPFEGKA